LHRTSIASCFSGSPAGPTLADWSAKTQNESAQKRNPHEQAPHQTRSPAFQKRTRPTPHQASEREKVAGRNRPAWQQVGLSPATRRKGMTETKTKTAYTFVVNPFDFEVTVASSTEKEARALVWNFMLSDDLKSRCESIECIEQREAA
jgi:hypothetical protein